MRGLLVFFIWLLDLLLKFALGLLIVFTIWLPFRIVSGVMWGNGWVFAGAIVGAVINGLFEGCGLFLLGYAKRFDRDQ